MTTIDDGPLLVACLCAAWCGSCREYRATFATLARQQPAHRFLWVDIEDESDALAPFDLDIENFPTLLVARGDELRFLGTLLPHASTLARTVEAAAQGALPGEPVERPQALVRAVREIGEPV
jgi:thiol-disulfide isomerase/thioredoxin